MASKDTMSPRVAQFIEMCDFPCTKEQLLLTADECEFPDDVMDICEDLPNKNYESEEDVMKAVEHTPEIDTRQEKSGDARRSR